MRKWLDFLVMQLRLATLSKDEKARQHHAAALLKRYSYNIASEVPSAKSKRKESRACAHGPSAARRALPGRENLLLRQYPEVPPGKPR